MMDNHEAVQRCFGTKVPPWARDEACDAIERKCRAEECLGQKVREESQQRPVDSDEQVGGHEPQRPTAEVVTSAPDS